MKLEEEWDDREKLVQLGGRASRWGRVVEVEKRELRK